MLTTGLPASAFAVARRDARPAWRFPGVESYDDFLSSRWLLGSCPYRRQCAECLPPKFIGGLFWSAMGGVSTEGLMDEIGRYIHWRNGEE